MEKDRALFAAFALALASCATPAAVGHASQLERLFAVCWPRGAAPAQKVTLDFSRSDDVGFEVENGATNSTARCMREIALSAPVSERPKGTLALSPGEPPNGWVVLAWVKQVAAPAGAAGTIVDPAPMVAGCLALDGGIRAGLVPAVGFDPALETHLSLGGRRGSAATDAERCALAVLGSTRWPATRPFELALPDCDALRPEVPVPVELYDSGHGFSGAMRDPMQVKSAMQAALPKVSACWEDAIARRAGLSGGRTVRMQVDASGAPTRVAIAPFAADSLEVSDYLLDRCLFDAARGIRLPPGEAGQAAYTWLFAERG